MNEPSSGLSDSAIFLGLDGVVLDVSRRSFKLHGDIAAAIGGRLVDEEIYWELVRSGAPLEEIADLSRDQAKEYRKRWNVLAESPAYVELDDYLPQARLATALLTSAYKVVAVALRRKPQALRARLKALSFPAVAQLLIGPPRGDAAQAKARLIQSSPHYSRNAVIVGADETEVIAGRSLGVASVVVSGPRARRTQALEAADVVISGVGELPSALRRLLAGGRP